MINSEMKQQKDNEKFTNCQEILSKNRPKKSGQGLAAEIPIRPEVQKFTLEEANRALVELKERKIRGGEGSKN
ncbi:MAG: hypothetical protein ACE5NG_01050 [bacterium]